MKKEKTWCLFEKNRRNAIYRQKSEIIPILLLTNASQRTALTNPIVFSRNNISKVVQQLQTSKQ